MREEPPHIVLIVERHILMDDLMFQPRAGNGRRGHCAGGQQDCNAPARDFLDQRHHGIGLADTGRMASMDLMELNPALDEKNRTALVAVDLIESLFGKSTLMRK